MCNIRIDSDFIDFYDNLQDKNADKVYYRYSSKARQRGAALKYLNSIGIKTIDLMPVNKFLDQDGRIVVYTDPYGHSCNGKEILSVKEAKQYYSTSLASKLYNKEQDLTIKYLQIGSRRFKITYKGKNTNEQLVVGDRCSIEELEQNVDTVVHLPIFSIDYIIVDDEMLATDFNETQNLSKLDIESVISSQDIMTELERYIN